MRLVAEEIITEEQKGQLLVLWDRGEIDPDALPIPVEDFVSPVDVDEAMIAAALLLVALTLGSGTNPAAVSVVPAQLATMQQRGLIRLANALQDEFVAQAQTLAAKLSGGHMTVGQWQAETATLIERHTVGQTVIGNRGRPLSRAQIQDLSRDMQVQRAYLSRFSDTVSASGLNGEGLSEGYIAQRTQTYGGVGREAFFRTNEAWFQREEGPGWVSEYVAIDDGGTCSPCHHAQGFYLLGTGPNPGSVCLGRGSCRCERRVVFNLDEYNRLRGVAR